MVIGLWVATVSVIGLGVQLASEILVLFGFLALVLDLIACFMGDYFRVGGHVSKDRAWVILKRVDATFAAAITNALRPAPPVVAAAAVPYQAVPYQAVPYQVTPYQAAPQQAAPHQAAPQQPAPYQAAPSQAAQQPAPNRAAPYQPSPYQATPDILPGR